MLFCLYASLSTCMHVDISKDIGHHLSLCMPLCISDCLPACTSDRFVCQPVSIYVCIISGCMPVSLYIYLSLYLCCCMFTRTSVSSFVCKPVIMSLCMSLLGSLCQQLLPTPRVQFAISLANQSGGKMARREP
jgi:hypothetical protein